MSVTERPRCQARNSATELQVHVPEIAPSSGFSCAAYCERCASATGAGDRPSTPQMRFVTPPRMASSQAIGRPLGAERRPAERAVVVGVDEAGRERAPARVEDPVGGRASVGLTAPSAAMRSPSISTSPGKAACARRR